MDERPADEERDVAETAEHVPELRR